MSTSSNIHKEALEAFKNHLVDKGYSPDRIVSQYKLPYLELGNPNAAVYFDLVVLNESNRIEQYFEIKANGNLTVSDIQKQTKLFREYTSHHEFCSLIADGALGYYVQYDSDVKDFKLYLISSEITTLSQFIDVITSIATPTPAYKYFYRGQSNSKYNPIPSIYRNKELPALETKLFKEAIRRCPDEFSELRTTFQQLVKLQHYGIPTRLLDLTTNALIALYFAVETDDKDEGCVFLFKVRDELIKSYDSDAVSVVSNLARLKSFTLPAEYNGWEEFNESQDVGLLLHEIRYEKPHFQPCIEPLDLGKTFCVLPKLDNQRIRQQNGAFFLFGIGSNKNESSKLDEHPIRILIDATSKKQLRQQLAQFGICKSSVYPELEHIADEIKKELTS